MVVLRAFQPVLVITQEADHIGAAFVSKRQDGLNATFRIGASVDVIAEKDHHVLICDFRAQLSEKVEQCCKISVDVSYRDCRHGNTDGEPSLPFISPANDMPMSRKGGTIVSISLMPRRRSSPLRFSSREARWSNRENSVAKAGTAAPCSARSSLRRVELQPCSIIRFPRCSKYAKRSGAMARANQKPPEK